MAAAGLYAERSVANFNVRVGEGLAARFDGWASAHGGRSPALRHLIELACGAEPASRAVPRRLDPRPVKLTVRLAEGDACGLDAAASEMGLTRNAWAAALIRRRLQARPTFPRSEELLLIAVQSDLRRIGVNVNQIARALNTSVMEGRVLELELVQLEAFRIELRGHMLGLREALAGNLAYWQTGS